MNVYVELTREFNDGALRAVLSSGAPSLRSSARHEVDGGRLELALRDGLRIRTDFVTRPPRITPRDLARMRVEQQGRDLPFTEIEGLPLAAAHRVVAARADGVLPTGPEPEDA